MKLGLWAISGHPNKHKRVKGIVSLKGSKQFLFMPFPVVLRIPSIVCGLAVPTSLAKVERVTKRLAKYGAPPATAPLHY